VTITYVTTHCNNYNHILQDRDPTDFKINVSVRRTKLENEK